MLFARPFDFVLSQYATFFFPSCEGVGCGAIHHGLYTLPVLVSPEGARQAGAGDEPVVRTWTITSVHGDGGPLEITVQAKVRVKTYVRLQGGTQKLRAGCQGVSHGERVKALLARQFFFFFLYSRGVSMRLLSVL